VPLDVEKPRMQKNNPEISEKWPVVFANKPDLKMFYAEQEFNPSIFDKRDFQTNINLLNTNVVFNDYMDTFGLEVLWNKKKELIQKIRNEKERER